MADAPVLCNFVPVVPVGYRSQRQSLRNSSGSFAILAAMRRASSRVSQIARGPQDQTLRTGNRVDGAVLSPGDPWYGCPVVEAHHSLGTKGVQACRACRDLGASPCVSVADQPLRPRPLTSSSIRRSLSSSRARARGGHRKWRHSPCCARQARNRRALQGARCLNYGGN